MKFKAEDGSEWKSCVDVIAEKIVIERIQCSLYDKVVNGCMEWSNTGADQAFAIRTLCQHIEALEIKLQAMVRGCHRHRNALADAILEELEK